MPYYFDENYLTYISNRKEYIDSIYYSLRLQNIGDARYSDNFDQNRPNKDLLIKNIKSYIILNSRFNNPSVYNKKDIDKLIEIIEYYEATGIIFLDCYLLKLISRRSKNIINKIDIIPSVNTFLDSYEKCINMVNYIMDLGFNKPSKLILDRRLNRNIRELSNISSKLTNHNIKTELLVNEGCLYNCPYKINHDILISLSHCTNNNFNTMDDINIYAGCIDDYRKNPYKLITSPFIRPEDIPYYRSSANTFKISGRTKTYNQLISIIESYISKTSNDNLLFINDSQGGLKENYYIFSDRFPKDFIKKVTTCNKDCNNCNYCKELFPKISQKLEDFKL